MSNSLLTLADACERLGWGRTLPAQNRLRMRLLRATSRDQVPRLVRSGVQGSVSRVAWYHVQEVTRAHSPISRISGAEWSEALLELDCRIASIADRRIDLRVVPEIDRLSDGLDLTARAVRDLHDRLNRIV